MLVNTDGLNLYIKISHKGLFKGSCKFLRSLQTNEGNKVGTFVNGIRTLFSNIVYNSKHGTRQILFKGKGRIRSCPKDS